LVWGRSTSLQIAPFYDHVRLSIGWQLLVQLYLVPFSSCLTLNDLEIWVWGYSMSLKIAPFESLDTVSYSPSIVTIAPPRIVSEIKRDIGQKSCFFIPPLEVPRRNIAISFGTQKVELKIRCISTALCVLSGNDETDSSAAIV